jgi:hypothetical protein
MCRLREEMVVGIDFDPSVHAIAIAATLGIRVASQRE